MNKMKSLLDVTVLKFLIVGVINTIFGTAIMFGAYNLLGLSYWTSSALNYICGGILSYFLNKNFTFKSKARGWKPMFIFATNVAICYFVGYGLAKPLILYILNGQPQKIQENAAMLVGMCIYTVLNYFGQRFIAFKE